MFDIGSTELLLTAIVAIVVIGPKDLPRALYKVGQVIGKARGMARHFRTGVDAMVREVELEELEKKWAAENERIMKEYPTEQLLSDPARSATFEPEDEVKAVEGADPPEPAAAKDGPAV
jgi:sec-independent protein translocase protein TatB